MSQKHGGNNIYVQSWKNVVSRLSPKWLCGNSCTWTRDVRLHIACISKSRSNKLSPSCFCEIWALCLSWITYDHLYQATCLACWTLFSSLVPALRDRTSCAQVHELAQIDEFKLYMWKCGSRVFRYSENNP